MSLKWSELYGRMIIKDAPPGELEVASGDVGPPSPRSPALVWVGIIVSLIFVRILYEMAE